MKLNSPRILVVPAATILLISTGTATASATTAPDPVKYSNCAKLNKVYPHGVAKAKGVKDKVARTTKPVTTFVVNLKVYNLNYKNLDRDKDGIVCEKP